MKYLKFILSFYFILDALSFILNNNDMLLVQNSSEYYLGTKIILAFLEILSAVVWPL